MLQLPTHPPTLTCTRTCTHTHRRTERTEGRDTGATTIGGAKVPLRAAANVEDWAANNPYHC